MDEEKLKLALKILSGRQQFLEHYEYGLFGYELYEEHDLADLQEIAEEIIFEAITTRFREGS